MSTLRTGQRVKVTFEGAVTAVADGEVRVRWEDDPECTTWVPAFAVEALPDDPATDPVGTVRKLDGYTGEIVVLTALDGGVSTHAWVPIARGSGTSRSSSDVKNWPVIGAVPGTPAFEVYGHLNGGVS